MTSMILAIDIGASNVRLGLADRSGQLLAGSGTRFATPDEPAGIVSRITEWLDNIGVNSLNVASCAAPGPLDSEAGVLSNLHNRGWTDVPLAQMLADHLSVPVRLEDDATAAAVAEALIGAGAGSDPVGYVTISSGVGAGIVIGGAPFRGAHGLAGEIGHLVIDPAGPPCACGRRGDVEAYAGGLAISRRAANTWPEFGTNRAPSTAEIFARARQGDPRATRLVDDAAYALCRALAALAAVADPERIVVGGSVGLAHPEWINQISTRARAMCMAETGQRIDVRMADLGDDSALAGAALLGRAALDATRSGDINCLP